jgi:hypothetical protein
MPHVNEVQRRVVAGAMAELLGRGGKTAVADASGMSRNTVIKAEGEVARGIEPSTRLRAPGAGAKRLIDTQPGLLVALDELVHPATRGTPMSLLRWTSKSTAKLASELVRRGFKVSDDTVGRLLKAMGYSLQAPAKQKEGASPPDRDGQFRYLNDLASGFVVDGQPVISVDTQKKELVGEFANGGGEWQPTGEPTRVNVLTSSTPSSVERSLTGSTTSPTTKGGCRSETPAAPPSSPWPRFDAGGRPWAVRDSRTPPAC